MTGTNSPTTTSEPRLARGGKRILVGVIGVLVVLLLFAAPFLRYGSVTGEEFSPDRFRRRSYHYWEIPLLHVQVTPLKKQNETNELETYLTQKKLIRPANSPQERWDVVTMRRADIPAPPGDAEILCRYLDMADEDGGLVWLQWSKENPKLAKVFWPAVAEAARREAYVVIPELFHRAETASDAAELERQIAQFLAARYLRLAEVHQKLEQHDRALQFFSAALAYDADSEKALAGRAVSLRARGKTSLGNAAPDS